MASVEADSLQGQSLQRKVTVETRGSRVELHHVSRH